MRKRTVRPAAVVEAQVISLDAYRKARHPLPPAAPFASLALWYARWLYLGGAFWFWWR